MRHFSGVSPLRAQLSLTGLGALGLLLTGGCRPEELNQPQVPLTTHLPVSLAAVPTGGLIGEWKLDEMGGTNAADTKNGYNATVLGGAAFVPGNLGRALDLTNGAAGTGLKSAEMPSNLTLDDVQEGNYTLSAWFYPYSAPPNTGTNNNHWAILAKAGFHMGLMYEPDGRFSIRHYLTGPVLKNPHSANPYPLKAWHHVAGVVSKTAGTVTIYVNGAQAGSSAFTAGTAAREYGTTRFRIGKGSSNWAADGKVDQVRIYNRALTGAEISDLHTETPGPAVASNCVGAPSPGEDKTTYSERRVFLEAQGWWGERTNGSVPEYGDAEHLHVAMCFPLRDTVSGSTTFRIRVMGHKLPVGSVVKSTGLHDPNLGADTHISLASIGWNHTITQAEHDHADGWTKWDSVTFNTNKMPNGLREFRILTKVARPPDPGKTVGAEIHVSSGWCWTIANGTATHVASGSCQGTGANFTMARGWYDCFEYKLGEVRDWDPYADIPRNTPYPIKISGRDGAGDNTHLTGWVVRLNPDFHRNAVGFRVDSAGGAGVGKIVTIPAAQMIGPKVHKLVVIGFADANCTTSTGVGIIPQDGEVSAVLAIPLKVD